MQSEINLIRTIQLIRSENIGPRTYYALLKKFGSASSALQNLPEMIKGKKIKIYSEAEAIKEVEQAQKLGQKILSHDAREYPQILSQTYDPPPVIFYKGNIELLSKNSIAFVGTRNSSANGCAIARKIAAEIGEAGYVVTSGLARGIDTEAHKASLKTGTIAVVAGGIDIIYPPENKKLYEQISEQGLIISESSPTTEPLARHFPQRNRIIAGLSVGVVVVEAAKKSGSLITAEYAVREGREVFAVPGSPLDPRTSGTNYLIKSGAVLTETAQDIFDNLGKARPEMHLLESCDEFEFESSTVLLNDNLRDQIIAKLSLAPISVDEIVQQTSAPVSIVNEVLLELEITGKLQRQYGNKVSLAA